MTTLSGVKEHDAFAQDGEHHQITETGVAFSYDFTPALTSAGHTDLYLDNYGVISNTGGPGLLFTLLSTGTIVNESGGYISGRDGVILYSTDVALWNRGTISGFGTASGDTAVYLGATASGGEIRNYGLITGGWAGIVNGSNSSGPEVENYGTIEGDVYGMIYHLQHGAEFTVTNYGTINGGAAAIATVHGGLLNLLNYGTLTGGLLLGSTSSLDDDVISNGGKIVGVVKLGAGADTFENHGGGTSGKVFGQNGSDQLTGDMAADWLNGGGGRDYLQGWGGNDTLIGGKGRDTFLFFAPINKAGVDKITDFVHGSDELWLDNLIFVGTGSEGTLKASAFFAGSAAHDANDRIIYNQANGWLIYDSNGSAAGGAHHFATLLTHPTVTASDFSVW